MINVQNVLRALPHFDTFCSVQTLHRLIEQLRSDLRFVIEVAGLSGKGLPIHQVRFGTGSVKAMVLGGPHPHEPIGSVTVYSLLTLLQQGHAELTQADVAWHIIPCIDPDGALLNEEWTCRPFTLEHYIRGYYLPPRPDQVEFSFPISYRKMQFDSPSREAQILKDVIDSVRPNYFFSLHNFTPLGGSWCAMSRDIGADYHRQIQTLMSRHQIPMQQEVGFGIRQWALGIASIPKVSEYYDHLESQGVEITPEYIKGWAGASPQEYVLNVDPKSLVFIAELTYGRHPGDFSDQPTGEPLRQLKLRLFADRKFLATAILEEWAKTRADLDESSPFFRKIDTELVQTKDRLAQGVSEWYEEPLQYLLFNGEDSGIATEKDRIRAYMRGMLFLGSAHCFVRLLKASAQSDAVKRAIARLEPLFDAQIAELKQKIGFGRFEVIAPSTLAGVQLGCGLIALNSLLEAKGKHH